MYLYFDKQGILKEIISEPTRALSSNVNKILVYYEGMEDETAERLWVRYKYNTDVVTTEEEVTDTITDEIPHNEKRDLKFFKYFKEYPFFVATVPDAVLGVNGVVLATFRLVRDIDGDGAEDIDNLSGDSILTLGLVTFNVEVAVGAELGYIADDGYISISQFNYLIEHIGELEDDFDSKVDKTNIANRVYATDDNGDQTTIPVDSFYDGNIVRRDSNNSITVPLTPTQNGYAASKGYVDAFGKSIVLSLNSTTYVLTAQLKDSNGNVLSTQTIDLPLEATVVGGSYDNTTQSLILTLQSGQTITIPVGDLVSGLVSTDNLEAILEGYATTTYVDTELDTKQDTLVSGTNIKTLNGTSLLGSGDIEYDDEFDEESTNALQNQVISKEIKEFNYELAIIREELFEVLLTELDYKVSYAMNYVIPDSLSDSDGTHRLVYSETMLKEVEGNGVALNQLVQNGDFESTDKWRVPANGYVTFTVVNNIAKIEVVSSSVSTPTMALTQLQSFAGVVGHKYYYETRFRPTKNANAFIYHVGGGFSQFSNIVANSWNTIKEIQTCSSTSINAVGITQDTSNITVGDYYEVDYFEIIDLTQMFGAGNEPTTTSDNRIQWLLSLGYVPYNAGSLENTTISGVKLIGNNRLSLDRTQGDTTGWINATTEKRPFDDTKYYIGLTANNYINSSFVSLVSINDNSVVMNSLGSGYGIGFPMRVIGGQTYTIEFSASDGTTYKRVGWFDKEGSLISFNNETVSQKTAPNNAYWGVLVLSPNTANTNVTFTNITFHLTSASIGYKPYTETTISLPQTTLLGALNSHDTLSVVEGNVVEGEQLYNIVHTTNVGTVDLGTLNWARYETSGVYYFGATLQNMKVPTTYAERAENCITPKYLASSGWAYASMTDKSWLKISSGFFIRDDSYTNAATFKTAMSGILLQYELATPTQTIVAQDLHFDQVSSVIEQGGTIEPIFENVPPNITTTFVVKKAVGE